MCGVIQQYPEFHHEFFVDGSSLCLHQGLLLVQKLQNVLLCILFYRQAMPCKRKSFSSRKCSHSAPATLRVSSLRPAKHKQWTQESMAAALKAVEAGVSLTRASRAHFMIVSAEGLWMG